MRVKRRTMLAGGAAIVAMGIAGVFLASAPRRTEAKQRARSTGVQAPLSTRSQTPEAPPASGAREGGFVVTVLDADSLQPIEDARVHVGRAEIAETDARGKASARIPQDLARVTAVAEGYQRTVAAAPTGTRELELTLLRTRAIRGRVLDCNTGTPVAHARVVAIPGLRADYDQDRDVETRSDPRGDYALTGLSPGFWTVFVIGGTHVSPEITEVEYLFADNPLGIRVPPGGDARRDLLVAPTRKLIGRVVDTEGRPVEGVSVRASSTGTSLQFESRRTPALSGSDGRFAAEGLPSVDVALAASSPTHAMAPPGNYTSFGMAEDVTIVVRPKVVASFHVTDSNDVAINGAKLDFSSTDGCVLRVLGSALTGADGVASFAALTDFALDVDVSAPRLRARRVTFDSGDKRIDTTVVLLPAPGAADAVAPPAPSTLAPTVPAPATLGDAGPPLPTRLWTFHVVDDDGDPIERGTARVTWTHDTRGPDRNGRPAARKLPIWRGDLFIEAPETVEELAIAIRDVCGSRGELIGTAPTDVTFAWHVGAGNSREIRLAAEAECSGIVTDARGRALAGIRIDVKAGRRVERPVTTDTDGRFDARGLPTTSVELQVWQSKSFVDVPTLRWELPVADRRIVLRAAGTVTLHVRGPDGEPVNDAVIFASAGDGSRDTQSTTGEDGRAMLEGLAPGERYELLVRSWSDATLQDLTLDDWIARDDTVQLSRGFVFRGTVVDTQGRSLPGAYVEVGRIGVGGRDGAKGALAGADGSFVIDSVAFGEGTLHVAIGTAEASAPAASGDEATLVVAVGPSIRVRLPKPQIRYDRLGTMRLADTTSGRIVWEHSYVRDTTIPDLDATHSYDLFIRRLSGSFTYATDLRADGSALALATSVGASITGRVTLDGKPPQTWPNVIVGDGAVRVRASLESGGVFEARHLPVGTWTLRIEHTEDGFTYRGEARCATGEDIEIKLTRE